MQDHSGNEPVDTFADGPLDQISCVEVKLIVKPNRLHLQLLGWRC
jgi:hypothetical protein